MSEEKKYELLKDQTIEVNGRTLYRIRALKDFRHAKKGDLGGYIEKEENLKQEGNCWVGNMAKVYGEAYVSGNARVGQRCTINGSSGDIDITGDVLVEGEAVIKGEVVIKDHAVVKGAVTINGSNCVIKGHAFIQGCATISDQAIVSGNAFVSDHAIIEDRAFVSGDTHISNYAVLSGLCKVTEKAYIHGHAKVSDDAFVSGHAEVTDGAIVAGSAVIAHAFCKLKEDSVLLKNQHHLIIRPIGSRGDTLTFARSATNDIIVTTGCFVGNMATFKEQVMRKHRGNRHEKDYLMACDMAKQMLDELTPEEIEAINQIKEN